MVTQSGLNISTHAVLRYMERVMGIDVGSVRKTTQAKDAKLARQIARWRGISLEAVAQQILPDSVCMAASIFGDGNYPAGTHTVRIRGKHVVTVVV